MPNTTGPVTAYLARVRERADYHARNKGLDGSRGPGLAGDVPHLRAALEAVLRLADGWESNAPEVPLISREAAALAVRGVILATLQDAGAVPVPLLGESGDGDG